MILLYVESSKTKQINKTKISIDVQNKLVVVKGEGIGGWG